MPRYIDAEVAEANFEKITGVGISFAGIPTADVAPVIHAHWVNSKDDFVSLDEDGCPKASCFCSRCSDWLTASDEYACRGYFCPNCGAKMDEEMSK